MHVEGTITRATSEACNRFGIGNARLLDQSAVDLPVEPP
jgi:hypothetical protein